LPPRPPSSTLSPYTTLFRSDPDKLLADQRAKAAEPTAAQIQAVYDANRAALGGRTLEDVRGEIVAYLRRDTEQKAVGDYIAALQDRKSTRLNSSHVKISYAV